MPLIALLVLAGAGIAYAISKEHATPHGGTPHGGPLPGPQPPVPPPPPQPVVHQPTLKANEVYHFTIQVAPDPNVDIMALLTGHLPAGLLPQTMPLPENLAQGIWSFDAAWTGVDGALLSSLSSAAVTFTGAIDAGAFAPDAPPAMPPGLDPGLLGGGGGGGGSPGDLQGGGFPGSDPMGGAPGGIGMLPPGLAGPGLPPPGGMLPGGGIGLPPPAPHPIVSFGPHPSNMPQPKPPIQSFGPHATQHAQTQQLGFWGIHRTAGTLSQYHPHAGSAFRHWPYDVRPVPGLPGTTGVAGTLSGYQPIQHDFNRWPPRRAGSGNGHA